MIDSGDDVAVIHLNYHELNLNVGGLWIMLPSQ